MDLEEEALPPGSPISSSTLAFGFSHTIASYPPSYPPSYPHFGGSDTYGIATNQCSQGQTQQTDQYKDQYQSTQKSPSPSPSPPPKQQLKTILWMGRNGSAEVNSSMHVGSQTLQGLSSQLMIKNTIDAGTNVAQTDGVDGGLFRMHASSQTHKQHQNQIQKTNGNGLTQTPLQQPYNIFPYNNDTTILQDISDSHLHFTSAAGGISIENQRDSTQQHQMKVINAHQISPKSTSHSTQQQLRIASSRLWEDRETFNTMIIAEKIHDNDTSDKKRYADFKEDVGIQKRQKREHEDEKKIHYHKELTAAQFVKQFAQRLPSERRPYNPGVQSYNFAHQHRIHLQTVNEDELLKRRPVQPVFTYIFPSTREIATNFIDGGIPIAP